MLPNDQNTICLSIWTINNNSNIENEYNNKTDYINYIYCMVYDMHVCVAARALCH